MFCSIPQFRLASTPIQYDKVRHTSSSCVLLSLVTINSHYNEIYLQYVFYNLLVYIHISYHLSYVLVMVLNMGHLVLLNIKKKLRFLSIK